MEVTIPISMSVGTRANISSDSFTLLLYTHQIDLVDRWWVPGKNPSPNFTFLASKSLTVGLVDRNFLVDSGADSHSSFLFL